MSAFENNRRGEGPSSSRALSHQLRGPQAVPGNAAGRIPAPCCRWCGNPLSVHERAVGEVCGNRDCRHQQALRTAQDREQHERRLQSRAADLAVDTLGEGETSAAETVVGYVPLNPRRLVGLRKSRIRRFEEHLQRTITLAMSVRHGTHDDTTSETDDLGYGTDDSADSLSEAQRSVLRHACGLCGGDCCARGGTHAFVSVATIRRLMADRPTLRPREIFDAYTEKIGPSSYQDSCVFHSEAGCRLPREMRSNVCNGYYCGGLVRIADGIAEQDTDQTVISAFEDYYPERVSGRACSSVRVARIKGDHFLPVLVKQSVPDDRLKPSAEQACGDSAAAIEGDGDDED